MKQRSAANIGGDFAEGILGTLLAKTGMSIYLTIFPEVTLRIRSSSVRKIPTLAGWDISERRATNIVSQAAVHEAEELPSASFARGRCVPGSSPFPQVLPLVR